MNPGGIRLALGLEKPEDVIRDLAFSLDMTK
jgi:O-acetylhomoserine/O-acetylserine sulfhydrylase-like pyridoxal-dependent enzyme